LISIGNAGTEIASTNYWHTAHAASGLCYLSANAGTWRLLVPAPTEHLLPEMRTGTHATIEPSLQARGCVDIVFEDGTPAPFALTLDLRQIDRTLTPGECTLAVWTQAGKQLVLACAVAAGCSTPAPR